MRPVPTDFAEGSFYYRQLERYGCLAIYAQTHTTGTMVRYEVVRLRERPAHTWPNGHTTPAHEAYPGNTRWGVDGFTCFTLQEARDIFVPWLAELTTGDESIPEEVPPPF
jgi:hypothetical protein